MLLAVDVSYRGQTAVAAGVAFDKWDDPGPQAILKSIVSDFGPYVPGEFYRRELPCILGLLKEHAIETDTVIVDGFVYLDGSDKPGLGKHLYDELGGRAAIVGVAKTPIRGISNDFAVLRGQSSRPLYVTAVGMKTGAAKEEVAAMSGRFRVPDLLKMVDQACRNWSTLSGRTKHV